MRPSLSGLAALLLGVVLAFPPDARADLANGGFERVAAGGVPARWQHTSARVGYAAESVSEDAFEGRICARLSWQGEGEPKEFGNLMQSVDAKEYRGKRVRFRAAVRVEGESEARLWLRVDREGNAMGAFDNMQDRPIVSGTWGEYIVTGDVDEDATQLNVGCMAHGTGFVYVDDAALEIVGDAPRLVDPQPPGPLTARGTDNLAAFARLFGVVRHFHPADEAANADWERIAVGGIKAVETAENARELSRILEEIFHPVAPSVAVFPADGTPPRRPTSAGAGAVRAWQHHGYGQGTGKIFESTRVDLTGETSSYAYPGPDEPWEMELGAGVACRVPLAVYADGAGTLPRATAEERWVLPSNLLPTATDRGSRLGTVVIAWNVLQHFYPYFDVVDTDWTAALRSALETAATDDGESAFLGTLRRLAAALQDGHARVMHPSEGRGFVLPLVLTWIGDELVVVAADERTSFGPGDVIEEIDGIAVARLREEEEAKISGATRQWIRQRLAARLVRRETDEVVSITARSFAGGDKKVDSLVWPKDPSSPLPQRRRPEPIAELEPGVWYVDTTRFDSDAFRRALPSLAQARGLVFDFRGYPGALDSRLFLSHLADEELLGPRTLVPVLRRPDRMRMAFLALERWRITPAPPRLAGKKAFLIDGGAISYAESCLGVVEAYQLGDLVGEATAGTNGNVNTITLPADYRFFWTGIKVLKDDETPHHGIGILPTIPASPTREGVAAGRDEVLERAVARVRG